MVVVGAAHWKDIGSLDRAPLRAVEEGTYLVAGEDTVEDMAGGTHRRSAGEGEEVRYNHNRAVEEVEDTAVAGDNPDTRKYTAVVGGTPCRTEVDVVEGTRSLAEAVDGLGTAGSCSSCYSCNPACPRVCSVPLTPGTVQDSGMRWAVVRIRRSLHHCDR